MQSGDKLYSEEKPVCVPAKLRAVPYFAWGNRGVNQMRGVDAGGIRIQHSKLRQQKTD